MPPTVTIVIIIIILLADIQNNTGVYQTPSNLKE